MAGYTDPSGGDLELIWSWDGTLSGFDTENTFAGGEVNGNVWSINTALVGEPIVYCDMDVAIAGPNPQMVHTAILPFSPALDLANRNIVIKCICVRDDATSSAAATGMGLYGRGTAGSIGTTGYLFGSFQFGSSAQVCYSYNPTEANLSEGIQYNNASKEDGLPLEMGCYGDHLYCSFGNRGSGYNIDTDHSGAVWGLAIGTDANGSHNAGFYAIEIFEHKRLGA